MNCILCDKPIDEARQSEGCCFHPGTCAQVFTTDVAGGRYDPDMAYRDVYFWSCCGKREPSRFSDANKTFELPPERSPGCYSAASHRFQANVLIISSTPFHGLASTLIPALKTCGFVATLCALAEVSVTSAASYEALVFLLTPESHDIAVHLTENIRQTLPDLPIVIFSEPDRVDGWKIQAESLANISEKRIVESLKAAVRNRYVPYNAWHPRTFLSYTRKDANLVRMLISELSRFDRACWVDTNILVSGVEWSTEIVRGIESSDLFVLTLSPNTPERTYCWLELATARRARKTIFVISYGDSLGKLLNLADVRGINWQTRVLKPRFRETVTLRFDDPSSPSFVLFEAIPGNLSRWDELSRIDSMVRCIQDWPKCLLEE